MFWEHHSNRLTFSEVESFPIVDSLSKVDLALSRQYCALKLITPFKVNLALQVQAQRDTGVIRLTTDVHQHPRLLAPPSPYEAMLEPEPYRDTSLIRNTPFPRITIGPRA